MAGHSKWKQIKHKKAATDAKKSQIFGKLSRLIAMESKRAGGDTSAPGLRLAIEKARAANMPSDNIERAVQKGSATGSEEMESVVYEAYGPGGAALIIEGLTDNRNRTSAELRHLLSKNGAQLAEPGAASWAFKKGADGSLEAAATVPLSDDDGAKLAELLELLDDHDDVQEVYTNAV